MRNKLKQKLEAFFDGLDCDLEIGLAYCLAEKCGISVTELFSAYEAWQVSTKATA